MSLDPDVERTVSRRMRDGDQTFDEVINEAVRSSIGHGADAVFETKTASMGRPGVNLDGALRLASELDHNDLGPRTALGS